MPTAAQLRQFVRLIDVAGVAVWVCDQSGQILFASRRAGELAGCEADDLIGVRAVSAASAAADVVAAAAAKLAPPPGIRDSGAICVDVALGCDGQESQRTIVFLSASDDVALTFAVEMPTDFDVSAFGLPDAEIIDAMQLQRTLIAYRKKQSGQAQVYLAGRSLASARLRKQVDIACRLGEDTLILAPEGFPVDAIAHHLHASAVVDGQDHPMEFIDGSLMDIELLEAVGSPLIGHLTADESATATAVIRDIDQMPLEAQTRAAQWKSVFGDRLRIIASADQGSAGTAIESADWLHTELRETLGAMSVSVPPLCSRPDDTDVLATALLEMHRVEAPTTADRISRDAMDTLIRYPWPGDVRELADALRHAVRVCTQGSITRDHLPLAIRSYRAEASDTDFAQVDLDQVLRSVERRLIERALESADGNRAEAARRLGISRARLLRRIADNEVDSGPSDTDRTRE